MALQPGQPDEPAEIALRCHPTLHLVPLLRQDQPPPPVQAHLHGRLAAEGVDHHHLLLRLVEHRAVHPRVFRLQPGERLRPEPRGPLPRQPDDLVYCGGHQHHHRLYRLPATDTAHQFIATARAPEGPVDYGVLPGLFVSSPC